MGERKSSMTGYQTEVPYFPPWIYLHLYMLHIQIGKILRWLRCRFGCCWCCCYAMTRCIIHKFMPNYTILFGLMKLFIWINTMALHSLPFTTPFMWQTMGAEFTCQKQTEENPMKKKIKWFNKRETKTRMKKNTSKISKRLKFTFCVAFKKSNETKRISVRAN